MADVLDSMEEGADSQVLEEFIEGKVAERKKAKGGNVINFDENIVFYEDSEGDMNVISEDEDLVDATRYVA